MVARHVLAAILRDASLRDAPQDEVCYNELRRLPSARPVALGKGAIYSSGAAS